MKLQATPLTVYDIILNYVAITILTKQLTSKAYNKQL